MWHNNIFFVNKSFANKAIIKFYRDIFPAAIGKNGISYHKREGDKVTPAGKWRFCYALYRGDRLMRPETSLPIFALKPDDGWCDAPEHHLYNKQVKLPFAASAETLWRDDNIYDIIIVLDYNYPAANPFLGSAIFFHIAREGFTHTQGCVAVNKIAMLSILKRANQRSFLQINC